MTSLTREKGTVLSVLTLCLLPVTAYSDTYEDCLFKQLKEGDGSLTLAEIRQQCQIRTEEEPVEVDSVVAQRVQKEEETLDNRFAITPHRPNYLLPISYNKSPNETPFEVQNIDNFSSTEIKFQLSVKAPLAQGVFNGYGDIYVAYTNTSWWQAYNSNSAPFRETNHEPEVFMVFPTDYQLWGFDLNGVAAGITHQSNGRSGELSLSWNRIYAQFIFSRTTLSSVLNPGGEFRSQKRSPVRKTAPKAMIIPILKNTWDTVNFISGIRFRNTIWA